MRRYLSRCSEVSLHNGRGRVFGRFSMIELLKWVAVVCISAAVGFFLSLVIDFRWVGGENPTAEVAQVDRLDLASIAMTAATLALGASALVVTVLGVVGARAIRAESVAVAKKVADEVTRKRLEDLEPTIKDELTKRLDEVMMGLGLMEKRELSADYDPAEGER
jgi:hypothetical protein